MKYQSISSFEKHLKEAAPDHLAPIYMVISSCDFERKKIIDKISSILHPLHPLHSSAERLLEDLNTSSLFGGPSVVILDPFEENEAILHYLAHPNRAAHLILGTSAAKPAATLYQKGKKEMVVLDLSDEKPWDRRRRLSEWLIFEAKEAKKVLTPDAIAYIFEHVSLDMAGLSQELQKLICFVGERPTIQLSDAEAVIGSASIAASWQLAEELIWNHKNVSADKTAEPSFLLPFIGQLRYHLQVGYQIATLLERNAPHAEYSGLFPTLRPQTLEKYITAARTKKIEDFRRGLIALFDLEFACKSSSLDTSILFDRFFSSL